MANALPFDIRFQAHAYHPRISAIGKRRVQCLGHCTKGVAGPREWRGHGIWAVRKIGAMPKALHPTLAGFGRPLIDGLVPAGQAEIILDSLSCERYSFRVKEKDGYDGDQLLAALAALANIHRLRVIAALATGGRNYVSRLAREVGISRPLLHLHLLKLEQAGLVSSQMELSKDGKALNYYEVRDFSFAVNPIAIAQAAQSLATKIES